MNNILKKQLEQLGLDPTQKHFYFPKRQDIKLVEDQCYIIKLTDEALFPNPGAAWVANYNQGWLPSHVYWKVDINRFLGDMVKVTGLAYDPETKTDIEDTENTWSGWLPLNCIQILEKI